jgi:hypothetical protein
MDIHLLKAPLPYWVRRQHLVNQKGTKEKNPDINEYIVLLVPVLFHHDPPFMFAPVPNEALSEKQRLQALSE